ncbi:hypothetical protein C8J57DRAFT_1735619 [Mycena rebaudengoi]|nr:hypothetical protein C8J57DRAFT_1735619 [Mycena rebaudengoi]
MATQKKANARKPKSSRGTGTRKSAKENHAPVEKSRPQPKPQPAYKNAPPHRTNTLENDAAAALVSMGTQSAEHAAQNENFDTIDTSGDVDEFNGSGTGGDDYRPTGAGSEEEDEDERSADESGDDDEELDEAVKQIAPTVKLPASKFAIPFEVPYKNGMRALTGITSSTSFDDFIAAAAARMETRVSLMTSVGYIPSYKPKSPKPLPKLLEDDESWEVLIADVRQHIKTAKGKNRGKGEVAPFSIFLIDTSKVEEGGKAGKGKKGKKGKDKDTEEDTGPVIPALKEHELFKKIKQAHYCQACKTPCVVLDSGDHHSLTHSELATWAMLASRHQAVIGEAPKELKLDVSHVRQKKAKNHNAAATSSSNDAAPWIQGLQAIAPVLGALFSNRPALAAPEWQPSLIPGAPMHVPVANPAPFLPSTTSAVKRPAEDAPSADICPDIITWITNLDEDPVRGRLKLNYFQYKDLLIDNGFFELSDLANVSAEQLMGFSGPSGERLNFGIANRLVTYAKEDYVPFPTKKLRVD